MKEWYSDKLTLDRIDNDWNYCKENCKWSTAKEQARNTKNNVKYNWLCISDIAELKWVSRSTIYSRIRKWRSIEEAVNKIILPTWQYQRCK